MARPKVPSLKVTGCVALFVVGLAFLLLADVAHGQCTVPNPQPYGLVLNSDLSIGVCLGWTWVAPPSSIGPLVTQWLPEKGLPIPAIVSTATNPNLIFASTSSIQMSFISETASYRNSLGYFVYDENQKVVSSNVVFPDFSSNPTTLGTGQTVKVGPFATGTRVGFFLVGNGYNDYFWATNLASMTFYSLWGLNADKKQHVAMFTEGITGRIIVGFEDLYNLGDADYNDAVFLVSVEGNIVNNLFPTTLMVTTYRNRDVRFTLQLNLGVAKSIVFNSLPSQGFLSQVNSDGTKGATITSTAATVTNPNLYLFFTPAINTHGQPYTTFSMSQTMPDGQVVPVIVRVDVVPFGIYTPWAYGASIPTTAARMTLIQLTGYEAYNVNLYATITAIPTFGILYQYNAGAVGARITAGNTPVTDPINRLYYQSNNQFITAAFWDTFQFVMSNTAAVSPTAQVSILVYVRPNNAPVSSSVRIIIDQNSVGNIDITATDADGDPLTLTVLTIPTTGQIFPTTDGSSRGTRITAAGTVVPSRATNSWRIIAVPNTITSGTAVMSFQFRISDFLSSNTYTATTNVNFVNQAPVSSPVSLTIWESSTMNSVVNTLWRVHANCDRDNAVTTLSVVILSVPSTGTLIDNNGVTITADTLPRTFANGLQVSYTPPFIGFGAPFATFSFRIIDDRGATSAPNTFTFNVNHVNHAPTAIIPSSVSTNLNVPVTIAISGVELDVGDTLVFYTTLPRRTDALLMIGNRNISADVRYPLPPTGATITYYPAAFQHYTDYIYVWVSDQLGAANVRLCYIYVNYVNILPVAQPITIYKNQLSPVDIILSATDANIPAERITYSIRSLPTRGTLSINRRVITTVPFLLGWNVIAPFRTVTYTNPPNSFGDPYATFTYSASDGKADSIPVAVTIHVGQTNQQPQSTMSPSLLQTKRFTPVTFAITTTDPDANDQVKIRFTIPVEFLGTLSLDGAPISDGFETPLAPLLTSTTFVYSPPDLGTNMDFGEKLDTFQYTAIDSNNLAAATVSVPIDVAYVARSPVITSSPSTISIQEQQQRVTTVNTNEPDGLPITVLVSSVPTNGKLYFADSQGLPTGDAITSGQVIASDSFGDTSTRIVYVAPIPPSVFVSLGASRDTYALTCRNSGKSTNLIINAIVTDRNFPPFVSATSPSVTIQSSQTSQTVIFTISGVDPDGNIINALATTISTSPGVTATNGDSALVANSPLTRATANANSWFITVNVPALTFGTVATITVITRDSLSASSTPLTLRLAINRVNFAPVTLTGSTPDCNEDSMVDIPLGGQDDNGDAITAYISQLPSIGTVTFGGVSVTTSTPLVMTNGIATVRYTPPLLNDGRPLTTFRYYVFDGQLRSSEQTLSINVNPVNHAPTAVVPASVSTNMNTPASIVIKGQDVDAGDTLTFMVTSLPTKVGSPLVMDSTVIAVNTEYPLPSSGVTLTYTPVTNQYYSDSVGVRVLDNSKAFDSKTVPVVVNYVNILPVTQSQSVTTNEDTPVSITLVATDANLPEETLSFTIRTLPSKGTLSVNGNAITTVPFSLGTSNTVSFTNAPYSHGSPYTTFAFTANDGKADSATSTVTISVTHVNHPPVVSTSSSKLSASRSQRVPFVVVAQDFDSLDELTVTVRPTNSQKGIFYLNDVELNGVQTFSYGNYEAMQFAYVAPSSGSGDNINYASIVVEVSDKGSTPATVTVSFDVLFKALPPKVSSSPSTPSLDERDSLPIVIQGIPDSGYNVNIQLEISSIPKKGNLYYVEGNSNEVLLTGPATVIPFNATVTAMFLYAHTPSDLMVSEGAQSDSFNVIVKNDQSATTYPVNIAIKDKNFSPFIYGQTDFTILDSQSDRHVTFALSGIDPDVDILNAYVLSHKNTEIKLQQDGNDVDITKPLKKVSDGLWKLDVVVPALFVGEVDRIKVYTQDPLGLKSSELELVVRTTYVNFAPVTTTTSIPAFNEDQSVTFTIGGKDDNKEALSAFISDLPHIGTLKDSNGNAITSNSTAISGGANGEWTLTYTPPLYTFGDPLTSIQYYVSDGELESAEQTLSIIVNHVNHAPVLVSNSDIYVFEIPHTSDDISSYPTLNSVITLNALDVDRADILKVNITSLPNSSFGYLAIDGEAISKVGTIVPAGANATFIPINYVSGEAGSFSYYVTDGIEETETLTVPVHVIDINHIPEVILTSESVNVNENSTVTVTLAQTGRFVDPDGDDLTLSLKTSPTRGVMSSISKTGTKTQSVWTFTYTPNFSVDSVSYGQLYDKVEFIVGDGKKSSSNSLTVNFNVLKVNFPPIARDFKVSGNLVESVVIDFSSRISDIHGESLSVIIKSLPATGSLTSNSQTIQPSQLPFTIANSGITSLEYHSPEPSQVDTSFKYAAFNGYAESGDYSVNVVITGFFNNPPIAFASPDTYTTPENQNVAITLGGLDEDGDFLTAYITKLPTTGVLRQTTNGISVGRLINAGDKVDLTDAWRLIYIPDSLKGEGTFSFSYHLNDSKTISNEQKVNLVVTNVIYPPTGVSIPSIVSTNEGTNVLITLQGTDPDGLSMTAQLTADTSNGFLFLGDSKGAIIDDKPIRLPSEFEPYVFPSSADGKWYVVYQPPAYKSGNGFDNFFFQVVNSANLKSVESIVLINVVAVNDPPIIDVPANITTPAGIAVPVKGIIVRELDLNVNNAQKPYVATVKADIGKVSIPNTVGVEVTPEDFATGAPSITITGRFSDVNAALSGLVFSPPPNVNGTTHVSVTVNDGGNTGIGGAKETTVQIKVSLSANVDDSTAGANVTPAVAGGAVGAVAAIAGAFWAFKRVSAKENYSFQLPEKDGDIFSSNPIYEADNEQGKAMKSNPLYQPAAASQ